MQYPGAIYHVMARGNGRQDIVRDDADRDRLVDYLGRAVVRCSWRIYAFIVMSNHLHVVLKTPEPNLSRGMQTFLSAYANVWSRRHRFNGHVFQGRYRTELIEDESYLWTVTRYVHLNPVRARLVENPAGWKWSSYPGYVRDGRRLEWVAYDELLASWAGEFGGSGSEPAKAYRRYVTAGLSLKHESPWTEAQHGWILGSQNFVDRIRSMVSKQPQRDRRREARQVRGLSIARVSEVVCAEYGIERSGLRERGSRHPARSGDGLSGETTHCGNKRRVERDPGCVTRGERAEPDTSIRGVAFERFEGSQAIAATGGRVDWRYVRGIKLETRTDLAPRSSGKENHLKM